MFSLEEITTEDGLIHQGLISYPKDKGDTAVIWLHGLTGTFYGNAKLLKIFAERATNHGMAFGTFNNRGHDMIAGFRKIDQQSPKGYTYTTIGAGYEVFEECVRDINAVIQFFVDQGYTKIILVGHSSGANKVCYYAGTVHSLFLSGIALLSPISDRLDPHADKRMIEDNLERCSSLIASGSEHELLCDLHFFPMTPKRYMSLISPHTNEDQFRYGDDPPVMPNYQAILVPMLVMFAQYDEYADRPIEEIQSVFDTVHQSSSYVSIILPCFHNFHGFEEQCVDHIVSWVKTIS